MNIENYRSNRLNEYIFSANLDHVYKTFLLRQNFVHKPTVDAILLACHGTTTDAQTGRGGCCVCCPPSLLMSRDLSGRIGLRLFLWREMATRQKNNSSSCFSHSRFSV